MRWAYIKQILGLHGRFAALVFAAKARGFALHKISSACFFFFFFPSKWIQFLVNVV